MACEKCERIGHAQRVLYYAKGGRWEVFGICPHKLEKNPKAKPRQTDIKRAPAAQKMSYSEEMDAFISTNYSDERWRHAMRGAHRMDKMIAEFKEKFGVQVTKGMIIGRYHVLLRRANPDYKAKQRKEPEPPRVYGTPSLPKLKFMEGWDADAFAKGGSE